MGENEHMPMYHIGTRVQSSEGQKRTHDHGLSASYEEGLENRRCHLKEELKDSPLIQLTTNQLNFNGSLLLQIPKQIQEVSSVLPYYTTFDPHQNDLGFPQFAEIQADIKREAIGLHSSAQQNLRPPCRNQETESKKQETRFQDNFLRICRLFHPPDYNGNDHFPPSSDGVPYTACQIRELAKSMRNRLRRIGQRSGSTPDEFLHLLEDLAKCKDENDIKALRESEKYGCMPYQPTQDRRTQVPRWNKQNLINPLPDADLCKKVYLTIELISLFGAHCDNRPAPDLIHCILKDNMVYRKYCTSDEDCHDEKRGCYNVLHLGIGISEVEFLSKLQELHRPDEIDLQELREWAKLLYKNFSMTRNSSAGEFLDLVRNRFKDSQTIMDSLIHAFHKNWFASTVGPCCYIKFQMNSKDDNDSKKLVVINKLREGVSKFTRKDLNNKKFRLKHKPGDQLVWSCDGKNKLKHAPYCVSPDHFAYATVVECNNIGFPSKLLKIMENTSQKCVSMSRINDYANINFYRFMKLHGTADTTEQPNVHEYFTASYTIDPSNNDGKNEIQPWTQQGRWENLIPVNRVKIKPISSSSHLNKNKVHHPEKKLPYVDNHVSFNLLYKQARDLQKCIKLLNLGEHAHTECIEKRNERCAYSYAHSLQFYKKTFQKNTYQFNVCLDKIHDAAGTHNGSKLKDLAISIENIDNDYLYISVTIHEFFVLMGNDPTKSYTNVMKGPGSALRTYYKKLPRGHRMECLQFNNTIREQLKLVIRDKHCTSHDAININELSMFTILITWNKDPITKEPLLKFTPVEVSRKKMTDLGIPDEVEIVALDESCKLTRNEYLAVQSQHIHRYIDSLRHEIHKEKERKADSDSVGVQTSTPQDSSSIF